MSISKRLQIVELPDEFEEIKSTEPTKVLVNSRPLPAAFMRNVAKALRPALMPNPRPAIAVAPARVAQAKKPRKPKPNKSRDRGFMDRYGDYRVKDAYNDGVKAWNFIKEYMNVEEKMFDLTATATALDYGGAVFNLSNIAQGSDYNNRDGNSVLVQKIRFHYNVTSSGTAVPQRTRILLLRDMLQNSTSDPTGAQILEITGSEQAITAPMLHIHDGNKSARRFRVLLDEVVTLVCPSPSLATAGTSSAMILASEQRNHEIHVGAHTMFQSTAGADASNWVGALYCVAFSNLVSSGPTVIFHSRIYFTDN